MSLLLQLTEVIIASSQSSRCQSQVTMGERTESNITSIASDIFREREGRERGGRDFKCVASQGENR